MGITRVLGCCAAATTIAMVSARADLPPRYVTLIHCDPHQATVLDWASLANLVEAAEDHNILLTIQFSPQWVPLVAPYEQRMDAVAQWQLDGHEISGHHHTLEHAESWDGYSNDENAPDSDREPGFLGDMQAWRWKVSELMPNGNVLRSTASWDSDFPAGIPFQTGGDGGPGVAQATCQPILKWLNDRPVWTITSAALYRGGKWYNEPLEAAFAAAGHDDIFTIAFHPSDYHPDDTTHVDDWFDFIQSQDADGERSQIPSVILEPYAFTPGDINYDEVVDVEDLLILLAAWDSSDPDADVNADALVDVGDLLMLLDNWTS